MVLPPDVFGKCARLSFWREGTGSRAYRITTKAAAGDSALRATIAGRGPR